MRTSTGAHLLRGAAGGCAAVMAAAVLAGCGGSGGSGEAAASSSSSPAAGTPAAELSNGLLKAEAFGPEATVVAVSLEQLQAGTGLAAMGKDLTVTPGSCARAVQGTQPDLGAFDDVAGVSATAGSAVTVEILLRGGPTEGVVAQLAEAVRKCPQAQITSPRLGRITVDFATLPVADLGDGSAAMRYTTSISGPDGTTATVPALIGAVEDGDRLVVLVSAVVPAGGAAGGGTAAGGKPAPGSAPVDPAAFAKLLEEAYQAETDALG